MTRRGTSASGAWVPSAARLGRIAPRRRLAATAAWLVSIGATLLVTAGPALAQDPSIAQPTGSSTRVFQKGSPIGPAPKIDKAQPLYLSGDELVYDQRGNAVTARGNVEIYYNNFILTADQVTYDRSANTLTAIGNVTLKEPNGNILRAERYTLTDDFRDGFVQQLSVVARDDTRIAALRANRRDGNVTEFEQGKFTPCKSDPGSPPLWCVTGTRIIHDQRAATITYQDAFFEVFGVPVLYMPYFQHPDPSVKRKSGFLLPEYTSSTNIGFGIEVPYYFALSPSYDFTFHPMYTTKHGVLWQGDWRQKLRFGDITGTYDIKIAAIEDGDTRTSRSVTNNDQAWSGSVETRGRFSISSWWNFGWDVTLESDDVFRRFYKLDSILLTDRVNRVFFNGLSERNFFGVTGYHFGGLLLNDTPDSESRVHPVVDWNYVVDKPIPIVGGELSWNVNALSFSRSQGSVSRRDTSSINRVVADVNWRRKFTDAIGITYTPFGNVRGDAYQATDVIDPVTGAALDDVSLGRGVASAGVLAAYPWVAHTAAASHVVEPLGQIIARTAKVDQRRLPNEDARSLVFDDTNLFELDKFSGYDRIETGTRANVGLQYTFQANSGFHARVLAGQSYHLSGDNVFRDPGSVWVSDGTGVTRSGTLYSANSGLETSRSDYVLAAYLSPFSGFRAIGQTRFDEDDLSLRRADALAQASYGPFTLTGLYSFTAAEAFSTTTATDQQEVLGQLAIRLTDRWSVHGQVLYDIDAKEIRQDQIGLRYADECFVLTATYTETFINNAERDLKEDRTLMLRFELKHIGEFRYKTDSLDHLFGDGSTSTLR